MVHLWSHHKLLLDVHILPLFPCLLGFLAKNRCLVKSLPCSSVSELEISRDREDSWACTQGLLTKNTHLCRLSAPLIRKCSAAVWHLTVPLWIPSKPCFNFRQTSHPGQPSRWAITSVSITQPSGSCNFHSS